MTGPPTRTERAMEAAFRRFYEELLAMTREAVPAALIVEKIRRAVPDRESRRQLVGHLRDSRDAFEREGEDGPTAILEAVIGALEGREPR